MKFTLLFATLTAMAVAAPFAPLNKQEASNGLAIRDKAGIVTWADVTAVRPVEGSAPE
jgi:hypothetical protein